MRKKKNTAESLAMCSTAYTMKLQLLIFMLVLILGSISADSSCTYDCVVKQYMSNSNLIMHAFIKRVSALNRRCYRRHLALITLRTGRNHPCLFPTTQFVSRNFSSCKYSTTVINCSRVHLPEWPQTILSKQTTVWLFSWHQWYRTAFKPTQRNSTSGLDAPWFH